MKTEENRNLDLGQGPKMLVEESVTIRPTQARRAKDHQRGGRARGVLQRGSGVRADQKVSRDCLLRKARDGMTGREVKREDLSPGAERGENPGLGAETEEDQDPAAETEEGMKGERRTSGRGLEMSRILRRKRRLLLPERRKTY